MQTRLPEILKASYGFEQMSQLTPRTYHLPEDMELWEQYTRSGTMPQDQLWVSERAIAQPLAWH